MEIAWPTGFHELTVIEESLRCGICYEFLETSVMTTCCSHNFCSLCIRKSLQYKAQCPSCFMIIHEKDLHTNRELDKLKESYLTVRKKLIDCIEGAKIQTNHSVLPESTSPEGAPIEPVRSKLIIRTPEKLNRMNENDCLESSPFKAPEKSLPLKKTPQKNVPGPSTNDDAKVPSMFTPKRRTPAKVTSKKVPCPVCFVDISVFNMDRHLDDCLKKTKSSSPPKSVEQKRKPLPKLVINLLKDSELKKLLKKHGLPTAGYQRTLRKRLERYTVLYNAECDKLEPRPITDVIAQCVEDEAREKREQKSSFSTNRLQVDRKAAPEVIEKAQKQYLKTNGDSYQQLIQTIKNRKNLPSNPQRRSILDQSDGDSCATTSTMAQKNNINLFQSDNESNGSSPQHTMDHSQFAGQDSDSNTSCPLQMYSADDPSRFLTIEMSDSDRSKRSSARTSFETISDKLNNSHDNKLGSQQTPKKYNATEPPIIISDHSSPEASQAESVKFPIALDDDLFDASTDNDFTDAEGKFDTRRKGKKLMKKREILQLGSQSSDSETDPEGVFAPVGRKPTKIQKQRDKDGKDLAVSSVAAGTQSETKAQEAKQELASAAPAPSCSKHDKENAEFPTSGIRNNTRRSTRKRNHVSYSSTTETRMVAEKNGKVQKVLDEQNENERDVIDHIVRGSQKGREKRKTSSADQPPPKRILRHRAKM